MSEAGPVILIVENMHWVDTASEEFLAHLAGRPARPSHPAGADDAAGLRAALARSRRWRRRSRVEGLGGGRRPGMVRTLLARGGVSEQLFKILAEKSEGNPLYVEEILRQLHGDERDRRREGRGAAEPRPT